MSAARSPASSQNQVVQPKRVYVEGHGCSASSADTEILRGMISQGGYELTEEEERADVRVLVTCSVKSVTEQRMLNRIRELSRNNKKLIVAGCLPKAERQKVENIHSNLSMMGPGNLHEILPTIETTLSGGRLISLESNKLVKLGLPRSRLNRTIGIVEISSGCLSSCTFCQVKLVKGSVFSYPEQEIVEEARLIVSQGAKEIWLTSTDNAAYGRETKTTLPSLVRKVCSLSGDFFVRVGMMNPLLTDRILDELIDCFRHEKVFKFLHLPVQSGSNRILGLMQRGYEVEDFYRTVEKFREAIPEITLSTDIIVGFPSETEVDYEQSLTLLSKIRPDVVNLSRFGARPGTKAAEMDSQIPAAVAKLRSSEMTTRIKMFAKEANEKWVGWTGEILVDEVVKNAVVGRNFAYKPCLLADSFGASARLLGKKIMMRVVGATASTLRVVPISDPIVEKIN